MIWLMLMPSAQPGVGLEEALVLRVRLLLAQLDAVGRASVAAQT